MVLRNRRRTIAGVLVIWCLIDGIATQATGTCATIKTCKTTEGKECTTNCPPCVAIGPNGVFACAEKSGTGCASSAMTLCEGQGMFAKNSSVSIITASPATIVSQTPSVTSRAATNTTEVSNPSSEGPSSVTVYLVVGIVVGLTIICAMLFTRRAKARRSITSPFGHTPHAMETSKPMGRPSIPPHNQPPSRAFHGDKADHEMEVGSQASITSFQTASSTGFSNSIFQNANGKIVNLGSSTSSLSSISSVFQVSQPNKNKGTPLYDDSDANIIAEEDPWDHQTPPRDSNSIIMMVEGKEEDDLFDKDLEDMRATAVTEISPRLFSECSSRLSEMSEYNDFKI